MQPVVSHASDAADVARALQSVLEARRAMASRREQSRPRKSGMGCGFFLLLLVIGISLAVYLAVRGGMSGAASIWGEAVDAGAPVRPHSTGPKR